MRVRNNRLVNIAKLVSVHKIQFVTSILKDELPSELNKEDYFVVKLSYSDKLIKIRSPLLPKLLVNWYVMNWSFLLFE